ncbi:MAG: exopolyphosphatase [Deltaproteobacteria bacterium]|nr:MAG: exopolyphosphatase [Deltaproteobacteria bacterium]
MRIVTRPDMDGLVCAVILLEAETIDAPILWIEPNDIQNRRADIREGDILANLPYDPRCSMWFDHHYTNRIDTPFEGAFRIAPSAAGIVYDYYRDRLERSYDELIVETDRIDAADLTREQVLTPERFPYIHLSMTIKNRDASDETYWNLLVNLLRKSPITSVMSHPEVIRRCEAVVRENTAYVDILRDHTVQDEGVTLTDLRPFGSTPPNGNRFLVYSLYPDAYASIKVRLDHKDTRRIILSVGHSIFNTTCRVNVGEMLSGFNGGGHFGAGACTFPMDLADQNIPEIIRILKANQPAK